MIIKKALFIGVNYLNSKSQLANCINDAHDLFNLFNSKHKIEYHAILTDDNVDKDLIPNKANIIKWVKWLTTDVNENDIILLHYSGHGSLRSRSIDKLKNCIIPSDIDMHGEISDDYIYDILCKPASHNNLKLYAFIDACHSGSILSLKHTLVENKIYDKPIHVTTNQIVYNPYFNNYHYQPISQYYTPQPYFFSNPNYYNYGKRGTDNFRSINTETYSRTLFRSGNIDWKLETYKNVDDLLKGHIYCLSGCADDETSSDGFAGNGAMTEALISSLKNPDIKNWGDLLNNIHKYLKNKNIKQKPQLCSNLPINPEELFFIE